MALVRAAAGERAAALEHNVLVQVVDPDPDRRAAAERVAGRLPAFTADDALASPFLLLGSPEDQAEQLRRHRDRWGISYVATHGPYGDAMAPVVERLAGT